MCAMICFHSRCHKNMNEHVHITLTLLMYGVFRFYEVVSHLNVYERIKNAQVHIRRVEQTNTHVFLSPDWLLCSVCSAQAIFVILRNQFHHNTATWHHFISQRLRSIQSPYRCMHEWMRQTHFNIFRQLAFYRNKMKLWITWHTYKKTCWRVEIFTYIV